MTNPLTTISDALIEFILSLLSDPTAALEFEQDPDGALANAGLSDICAADVRSVVPVVVDRPDVVNLVPAPTYVVKPQPMPEPAEPRPELIREIERVINHFKIDNRTTIVDQSVNQSIWADGDVTQVFDQEAVIAAGDGSVAAGDDAAIDESTTDIDAGDIAIGNTDADVDITDSFKDQSTNVDVDVDSDVDDSLNDQSSTVDTNVDTDDSFTNETETTLEQPDPASEPTTPQLDDQVVAEEDAYDEAEAAYSDPALDYENEVIAEELMAEAEAYDQP